MSRNKKLAIFLVHGKKQTDITPIKEAGFKVEEYTTCMEYFYDKNKHDIPGILVIDVSAIGYSIDETLYKLIDSGFNLPIILMSSKTNYPSTIKTVRGFWDTGFKYITFISKSHDKLLAAIDRSVNHYNGKKSALGFESVDYGFKSLSDREVEILEDVMVGEPSNNIALNFGISVKTVEAHRSRINAKMRVDDVADLLHMYLDYHAL